MKEEDRDTKKASIRLTEGQIQTALTLGRSVNAGVSFALTLSDALYAIGLAELRAFFTKEEWIFLCGALRNNFPTNATMAASKAELARVLSLPKSCVLAKEMRIPIRSFIDRIIAGLNAVHIYAIWIHVRGYQVNAANTDLDSWASIGFLPDNKG